MTHPIRFAARALAGLLLAGALALHGRDGARVHLGDVAFTPQADGRVSFVLTLRHEPFKDFFLSMKEFKCVESASGVPPYRPALRDDVPVGARWFGRLTIE